MNWFFSKLAPKYTKWDAEKLKAAQKKIVNACKRRILDVAERYVGDTGEEESGCGMSSGWYLGGDRQELHRKKWSEEETGDNMIEYYRVAFSELKDVQSCFDLVDTKTHIYIQLKKMLSLN